MVKPYTLQDVIKGLNDILPYDWRSFLEKRVAQTAPEPPLDGLTARLEAGL